MDLSQIYSLSLGSALLFLLLYRLCHLVVAGLLPGAEHVATILTQPRPLGRLAWIAPKSWSRFGLLMVYVGGTLVCNSIRVSTLSEASLRAAKISLANLVPLMVCNHELGTHLFGMSLDLFRSVHRTMGIMAFVQALAHGLFEVASTAVNLHNTSTAYGVAALVLFASLILSSLVKSEWYELFIQLHHLCALALVFTSWRHVNDRSAPPNWSIIGATTIYATTAMIWILRIVFRNLSFARRAECLVSRQGNYLEIILFPARPWKVQAGERVGLTLPSAGLSSLFQIHPFVVAWWDNNDLGTLESITLLVRPRAGFTSRLDNLRDTRHVAWIDGPYGPDRTVGITRSKLPDYGHLFMVATGIGVAAQLPYVKQLVEGYQQGVVRTQRITLIWQLDEAGDYAGAVNWLQKLIVQDGGYNLCVRIFDPAQPTSSSPVNIGQHELIELRGGNVDWQDELREELHGQVGTMLITVSAKMGVRNVFRRLAQKHRKDKVELLELEFQPWQQERSIWSYF